MPEDQKHDNDQQDNHEPEKDWLLQSLVSMANNIEIPFIQISLLCGGFIVSGILISRKTYLESLGSDFKKFFGEDDGGIGETVRKTFAGMEDRIRELPNQPENPRPPSFIHLKNAKFIMPGQLGIPHEEEGTLWRGRISEVSGFYLGQTKTGVS